METAKIVGGAVRNTFDREERSWQWGARFFGATAGRKPAVAKPEWGTKRECHGCGARFYDLRRDPVVCPGCGAVFVVKAPKPEAAG